jgi:hypothetical protein
MPSLADVSLSRSDIGLSAILALCIISSFAATIYYTTYIHECAIILISSSYFTQL